MIALLIASSMALPLALALGYTHDSLRPVLHRALPYAALPALFLALAIPDGVLELPWLLEGAAWGLDGPRRTFLAFSALLWTVSGLYARNYFSDRSRRHFALFWLLALAGNLGLVLALDIASFYTFYTLMTVASYGLVAHHRSRGAHRAGRWYLAMAMGGEMALLAGLIMAAAPEGLTRLADVPAAVAASEYRDWVVGLLFFGFGVKAGAALLHFWLPLAYLAAPTPGAAVLGGAMINAGLLGWLFTLPLGSAALPGWAALLCGMGLLSAFGGALAGVCQENPKAVLAYSSISQMGLITLLLGVALAAPEIAGAATAAIAYYAMHHGLAKGALFLAIGTAPHAGAWPRWLFWLLAALPGLSLSGLLLTSGAAAKDAFKEVLAASDPDLAIAPWLPLLLGAGAVATTLLVARFLWCLRARHGTESHNRVLPLYWTLAVMCSLLLFWLLPRPPGLPPPAEAGALPAGLSHPLDASWPLLLGLALAAAALLLRLKAPRLPPGDFAVLAEKGWYRVRPAIAWGAAGLSRAQRCLLDGSREAGGRFLRFGGRLLERETALRDRADFAFVLLLACLFLALLAAA